MSDATPAPYPADTKAKGWRFELDYEQIEQSDTWARTKREARPWLLMLWMVSWKQVPCGSLPNDREAIAGKIDIPDALWSKHADSLMRGWWLAEDGRLYHDKLTKLVLEMTQRRGGDASRKKLFDEKFYAIRDRDGGACVYCGATKYLSLDHLIASSRGGGGGHENLVCACRSCNSRKGARTPDEAGLAFVNKSAERLWLSAKGTLSNVFVTHYEDVTKAKGTLSNVFVTHYEDVTKQDKNTYHRPPNTEYQEVKTKTPRKRAAAGPHVCVDDLVAEGVDRQHATDWLTARKAKGLALTPTAWQLTKDEAAKAGLTLPAAIKVAAGNGWGGFKATWLDHAGSETAKHGGSKQAALESRNAAAAKRVLESMSNEH